MAAAMKHREEDEETEEEALGTMGSNNFCRIILYIEQMLGAEGQKPKCMKGIPEVLLLR